MRTIGVACALVAGIISSTAASAEPQAAASSRGCEELFRLPGVVWRGTTGTMTFQQLASYAAPVFWLSPDEPTLEGRSGTDMRVPSAMPFEKPADGPVVYYQVTRVDELPNDSGSAGVRMDQNDKAQSVVNFDVVTALRLKYIAYFPQEAGVGQHQHDVEPTEFRILVGRADGELAKSRGFVCNAPDYLIVVTQVTGEAHGNPWYYNVLSVDQETRAPIHVLVEEGKHATVTDKNGDGYYTPGYDVSIRTNDAWGLRDTIRGGTLFTGKFESWMAKVRRPEHQALPPLPQDSPIRARVEQGNLPPRAVYQLRPYPSSQLASADELLRHKMEEKETKEWPVVRTETTVGPILNALLEEGRELKPFSAAYRYDGSSGFSVAFPLLIFKNVQEPLSNGYIVNRLYFSDKNLRDWGWMLMFTPSASRWFDQYLAMGMDVDRFDLDDGSEDLTRAFVLELGVKLRFRAPNRVMNAITPFWGFRAGLQNVGSMQVDHFTYVLEIGAGVW